MAEDESRVHKASEVHKRRAPKKVRPEAQPAEKPQPAAKQAAKPKPRPKPRTRPQFLPNAEPEAAPTPTPESERKSRFDRAPDSARKPEPAPDSEQPPEKASTPRTARSSNKATSDTPGEEPPKSRAERHATRSTQKASDEPAPESAEGKPRKQRNKKLWIAVGVAAFVVVALAVTAAALAWNRWARYDDGADMQGIWYAYGTEVPVTFTQDSIIFDENTAYTYEIDAEAKTIRYSIGDMEGQGRYWFDDDRDVLIVTDGDDFTKWGTVLDDAGHWLHDLFNGASLPMTADSIAFSRIAMTDGFVTVAPEEGAGEATGAEGGEEPEGQEPQEQPVDDSGGDTSGEAAEEPTDEAAEEPTGKEAMKELPISDIIEEDDTPEWSKKSASDSEAEEEQ